MTYPLTKINLIKTLILIGVLLFAHVAISQKPDTIKLPTTFNGAVTVTNNGVSLIPTFSLGKPAMIFDFVVRKKSFSFEPQIRFAIEDAKPWSFIFWMRYKLIQSDKFKMGIGAHPSFVFQTNTFTTNGVSKDFITTKRFFAGELTPNYFISKNVSVGVYYLFSRGLAEATKTTNFVGVNSSISNIKLGNDVLLKLSPQIYYLQLDEFDGFYATSTFTLTKRNFPFSLSSIVNQKIQSNIVSNDFVWNIGLTYLY